MKNLYLSLLTVCLCFTLSAQNIIDTHYADMKADPENTVIFVSGRLFNMASHFIPDDEEIEKIGNIKELATKVNAFNLVVDKSQSDPVSIYKQGIQEIRGSYDELIEVRDGDNRFSIMIDEEDGIVYELVGLGTGENEFIVFSLEGAIDLDQVGKIISKINETQKKNKVITRTEVNFEDLNIYPNPSSTGSVMNLDIPEELAGGKIIVYDVNGAVVSTQQTGEGTTQLKTDNWTPGNYYVEVVKDEMSIKRKVLVIE